MKQSLLGRLNRPSVFIVSFPKSGRTWVEMMVAHLYCRLAEVDLEACLKQKGARYRERRSGRPLPSVRFGHGYKYHEFSLDSDLFPTEFYAGARVVLLVRDPRDVVVSSYYYHRFQWGLFQGSLQEYIDHPVSAPQPHLTADQHGRRHPFGLEPILGYLNAWNRHRDVAKELMVQSYEDFHRDTEAELGRLASFIGLPVEPVHLREAVRASSFGNMRELETSGSLDWYGLPGASSPHGLKTRKGKVGGYLEEISPEQLEQVNARIRNRLNPFFERYY